MPLNLRSLIQTMLIGAMYSAFALGQGPNNAASRSHQNGASTPNVQPAYLGPIAAEYDPLVDQQVKAEPRGDDQINTGTIQKAAKPRGQSTPVAARAFLPAGTGSSLRPAPKPVDYPDAQTNAPHHASAFADPKPSGMASGTNLGTLPVAHTENKPNHNARRAQARAEQKLDHQRCMRSGLSDGECRLQATSQRWNALNASSRHTQGSGSAASR